MKGTRIFNINSEDKELPLFEEGDRVYIPENDSTAAERVEGTVTGTSAGGLFVDVKWDKEVYPSVFGGTVQVGSGRMVDGIKLIEEETA
jgi:hypothetical protein